MNKFKAILTLLSNLFGLITFLKDVYQRWKMELKELEDEDSNPTLQQPNVDNTTNPPNNYVAPPVENYLTPDGKKRKGRIPGSKFPGGFKGTSPSTEYRRRKAAGEIPVAKVRKKQEPKPQTNTSTESIVSRPEDSAGLPKTIQPVVVDGHLDIPVHLIQSAGLVPGVLIRVRIARLLTMEHKYKDGLNWCNLILRNRFNNSVRVEDYQDQWKSLEVGQTCLIIKWVDETDGIRHFQESVIPASVLVAKMKGRL